MNYRYLVLALLWLGHYSFGMEMEDQSIERSESSEIGTHRPKDFLELRTKKRKERRKKIEYKQELRIKLAHLKQDLKHIDAEHRAALEKDNIEHRAALERRNIFDKSKFKIFNIEYTDELARKRARIKMRTRQEFQDRLMQASASAAAGHPISPATKSSMYV